MAALLVTEKDFAHVSISVEKHSDAGIQHFRNIRSGYQWMQDTLAIVPSIESYFKNYLSNRRYTLL